MEEFVSEVLTPHAGTFHAGAMATGVPGLPAGFDWRGQSYSIATELESWKQSGPEIGKLAGERYLRRHYFRLRISDEMVWTVYFVRHTPRGGSARQRWFLYSIEHGAR
ncbi:MAG: DUF6504 family protein [Planctomycetota bacterium]